MDILYPSERVVAVRSYHPDDRQEGQQKFRSKVHGYIENAREGVFENESLGCMPELGLGKSINAGGSTETASEYD